MTASINRLSCDKYTGTNITQPLLPMERGGLSFINTWGRRSHAEWLEWANNTHPDNEGDVLIQALLQLPLDFTQRLCMRVFCPLMPLVDACSAPSFDEGQTTPLHREQWFGDVGACVLVTGQTIDAGRHG